MRGRSGPAEKAAAPLLVASSGPPSGKYGPQDEVTFLPRQENSWSEHPTAPLTWDPVVGHPVHSLRSGAAAWRGGLSVLHRRSCRSGWVLLVGVGSTW